jgi:hypothetical protein
MTVPKWISDLLGDAISHKGGNMGHRSRAFWRFLARTVLASSGIGVMAAAASGAPQAASGNDYPFAAFAGEWTLKDDKFQHVGDGRNVETLTIPNHHTKCAKVNTDRSILCVVKAGDLNGHILWTYDSAKKRVHWLSHFGTQRTGHGSGTFDAASNLTFRLNFTDEPEGSYREYRYTWLSPDEYRMMSRQYQSDGRATGNWYGGTFVRLPVSQRRAGGEEK